ncbi:MAG: phosphomannomutase, partial [Hydrogenovibrio sp.]|nr:phosphomannomutase [Hydrogenovibrio sp.]
NYTVEDVPAVLEKVMRYYAEQAPRIDKTDGISLEFDQWRMNIRLSNTEPLLRLNVEAKADEALVWQKVKEIETLIQTTNIH